MSDSAKEIVTDAFRNAFGARETFGSDSTQFADAFDDVRELVVKTGLDGIPLVRALAAAETSEESLRVIKEE